MRSLLRYAPHAFVALGLLGGVPSVASAASRTPVPVRGALADRSHLRGLVPGTQTINLVFHLRPRNHELLDRLANRSGSRPALSAQRVHDLFAPRRHTRAALIEYLEAHGLNAGGGQNGFAVLARGSNAAAESALAVSIGSYQSPKGTVFRAPVTEPKLPTRLATGVTSISGLDTSNRAEPRVVAQPNAVDPQLGCTGPGAMHGTQGALLPSQLAGADGYNFQPLLDQSADGSGEKIAFVEFSYYNHPDIASYQACFGTNIAVTDHQVLGGTLNSSGAIEVELDLEVAASAAPSLAGMHVYMAPNGPAQISDVIGQITADQPNTGVHIISISWGLCEYLSSEAEAAAQHNALAIAALQGISVYVASGDDGSSGCAQQGPLFANADLTSSEPYATGVGGTTLYPGSSERVWNDSSGGSGGGGVSEYFEMPDWQAGDGVHNPYSDAANCGLASGYCRQSPDISLVADPATGYPVYCTSQAGCAGHGWMVIGGTSAAAPLMAAITADMNEYSQSQGGQRLGFANPFLYQTFGTTSSAFHDITDGSNDVTGGYLGLYPATAGYDMASGLGSVNANVLAQQLVTYSQNPTYPAGIWDASEIAINTPDMQAATLAGRFIHFSGYLTENSTGRQSPTDLSPSTCKARPGRRDGCTLEPTTSGVGQPTRSLASV